MSNLRIIILLSAAVIFVLGIFCGIMVESYRHTTDRDRIRQEYRQEINDKARKEMERIRDEENKRYHNK